MDAAFVPSCTTCPRLTLVSSLKSVLESIPSQVTNTHTHSHSHQLIPPHKLYLHVNSPCAAWDEARTSPLRFKWKSQRPLYVPQPCLHSITGFEAAGCSSPQSHVFYSNRSIFDSLTTVTQTKKAVYSYRLISNIYLRGSSQLKLPTSPTAFFQIQKSCYNSSRSQDGWINDWDKMSSRVGSREENWDLESRLLVVSLTKCFVLVIYQAKIQVSSYLSAKMFWFSYTSTAVSWVSLGFKTAGWKKKTTTCEGSTLALFINYSNSQTIVW